MYVVQHRHRYMYSYHKPSSPWCPSQTHTAAKQKHSAVDQSASYTRKKIVYPTLEATPIGK
jgi:hypothetical protein